MIRYFQSTCATAFALLVFGAAGLHAQINFHQLAAQKNAQAAAQTWGYKAQFPTQYSTRPPESASPPQEPFDPNAKSSSSKSTSSGPGQYAGGAAGGSSPSPGNAFAPGSAGRPADRMGLADGSGRVNTSTQFNGTMSSTAPAATANYLIDEPVSSSTPQRAEIRYNGDWIEIDANNSSLNQILWDIERNTGIAISGGVRNQRVYGHYGPASPSELLSELLRGTGTNILIRERSPISRMELILTPRAGVAAAPSPSAADDVADPTQRPGR